MNSSKYSTQDDLILNNLLAFYKTDIDGEFNPSNNLDKMLKIITGESNISIRIIDWFVTNYSKQYYVVYTIPSGERFKVYNNYKLMVKGYSKERFDPFCRMTRISIPYKNGDSIETTIGQLNFFKWVLENNIIEYIQRYYEDIEKDMNIRLNNSKRNKLAIDNKTRKKREELSVSATKSIKKEKVEIVVRFN